MTDRKALVFDFLGVLAHPRMRFTGPTAHELVPDQTALQSVHKAKEAGFKTALVSNNDRSALLREASDLGLPDLFDTMVFASDVVRPKPHPEMFLKVLADLELQAEACWLFDDSVRNVDAAVSLGMNGVVIDSTATLLAAVDDVISLE